MKILEEGKYPEENVAQCKYCGCKFQYYEPEVIIKTTSLNEYETFGVFGVTKYIKCPCCKGKVELYSNYEEDKSMFTGIKEWFRKRRKNNDKE